MKGEDTMKFYFNIDENCCMDESSLINYLYEDCSDLNKLELLQELRTHREFDGWYECSVSDEISKFFG